jgi:hypothetical protein
MFDRSAVLISLWKDYIVKKKFYVGIGQQAEADVKTKMFMILRTKKKKV